MASTPTDRLWRAFHAVRDRLDGKGPGPLPDLLLAELQSIVASVEEILSAWEGLETDSQLESVDANFFAASECYLEAGERLQEALTGQDRQALEEAERLLNRAARHLITANERAHQELERRRPSSPSSAQ